jgi:cell division septal protein FtsQ
MKEVNVMKTKKLIVLLVAVVFTLGVVGLGFSAQEAKCTVLKIEGNDVTILDDVTGGQLTVKVKDSSSLKDLNVGDKVLVKGDKVTKKVN